jgi:feruloyl esterase
MVSAAGTLLLVLLPLTAVAQPGEPYRPGDCQALRALTTDTRAIHTAEHIPASDEARAHCRVTGQILPEVGFEVRLPDDWNGRFLMYGNGGFAGAIQSYFGPGVARSFTAGVNEGFAVAGTDTGHDRDREPWAQFGTDRQKVVDFAYRAVHVTTVAAKNLIATYYGTDPERSYFSGCSTGGRQGLMAAQRFPDDYNGILVGAPVLEQSMHHVSSVWILQALQRASIHIIQLDVLAERVYATCDGVDGVEDGLIAEPTRCTFDPAADLPRCSDGIARPDCFTDQQVRTLETIYGDVTSNGETIFPGLPLGTSGQGRIVGPFPSYEGSGWTPHLLNQDGPSFRRRGTASFLRYLAFGAPNPDYDWRDFNIDEDLRRMAWIRSLLDATDPDLSAFRERGGKLLMYFGWADSGPNPLMGTRYYEDVVDTMGPSTTDFVRLFMIPGMFHCQGGVGNPQFERFAPLRSWVEKGTPPEHIEVSYHADGAVVRTRPACPYPQVARPTGSGSTDAAAGFACVDPR